MESLDFRALEMDLYLKGPPGSPPTLYRAIGVQFTPKDAARLSEQGVKHLYISATQHGAYRKMLSHKLESTVKDPARQHQERWKAVRSSCDQMIQDVLLLPGHPETVDAVGDVARAFSEWSRDEACGFSYLLDMSAHDFYTTSHMVNVGVGCGLLAKDLRPKDAELFAVMVQGGMLHDIGKRGIPENILNKEANLDATEWAAIHKHPMVGFDELKQHGKLPPVVAMMARDHHERMDGKGYPQGLTGDKIEFPARVCAVVDSYDAITAARPGRGPISPPDALGIMREGRGSQFDADLFDAWERLILRLIKEDPGRAVTTSAPGAVRPLRDLAAGLNGPPTEIRPLDLTVGDRRRHERAAYHGRITVSFLRQGKALPVALGEKFQVDATDISRGGVGLKTAWPLSLGDLLSVEFPAIKDGKPVKRYVKVVRVRSTRDEAWVAGCCFVEDEEVPR